MTQVLYNETTSPVQLRWVCAQPSYERCRSSGKQSIEGILRRHGHRIDWKIWRGATAWNTAAFMCTYLRLLHERQSYSREKAWTLLFDCASCHLHSTVRSLAKTFPVHFNRFDLHVFRRQWTRNGMSVLRFQPGGRLKPRCWKGQHWSMSERVRWWWQLNSRFVPAAWP